MLFRTTIVLATLILASAAQAQTGEAASLIKRARVLDGLCRGGIEPDEDKRDAACCGRTQVGVRLNALGWCYGKRGQIRTGS